MVIALVPVSARSESQAPVNPANSPAPYNTAMPQSGMPIPAAGSPNQYGANPGTFQSQPITEKDLQPLHYSVIATMRSGENGTGNISDPELGEIKGKLFMYFMNGDDRQAGKSGNDGYIHSYSSSDRGKTWKLDPGIRIAQKSPLGVIANSSGGLDAWVWNHAKDGEQLQRYSTKDGLTFDLVGSSNVDLSPCKNTKGETAFTLGDVQIVKLKDGTYKGWAFAVFPSDKQMPFHRIGCVLTSTNGTSDWKITTSQELVFDTDLGTNPETYRASGGVIEQYLPLSSDSNKAIRVMQMRTSRDDGKTWSALSGLSFFGNDPGRLDTSYGDKLLAYGNYDLRQGGVIVVTRYVSSSVFGALKDEPNAQTWYFKGVKKGDIKIMNLCLNRDLTNEAKFSTSGKMLVVKNPDTIDQMVGACYYALIGKQRLVA